MVYNMKKTVIVSVFLVGLLGLVFYIASTAKAATPALTVTQGGTGTTSPSGILYGDNGATLRLKTLTIGTGCTLVGSTLSCTGSTYPFPNQLGGGNATSSLTGFSGGIISTASSTIGNGTQGLIVSGNSTTTGQQAALGGNAVNAVNFCLTSTCQTGLYSNGGSTALSTAGVGITWGASGVTDAFYPNTDNSRNIGQSTNRWLNIWASGTATSSYNYADTASVGSSTPWAVLSVTGNGATGPLFAVGSSTNQTIFQVTQGRQTATCLDTMGAGALPATSTTMTVDWINTCPAVDIKIGAAAVTITLINATTSNMAGSRKLITVCNPGSAASTVSWVGAEWYGGTAPTQTTTLNQCDTYSFHVTSATSTLASPSYKVFGAQSAGAQ